MTESPIFTRLHDLILWLLRALRRFPRDQRPLSLCIHEQLFAIQKLLISASVDAPHKVEHLNKADIELKGLRKNLLLAHELGLFNDGQFRHVTGLVSEVGALLGGWLNPKPKTTPGAQSGAKPGAAG